MGTTHNNTHTVQSWRCLLLGTPGAHSLTLSAVLIRSLAQCCAVILLQGQCEDQRLLITSYPQRSGVLKESKRRGECLEPDRITD